MISKNQQWKELSHRERSKSATKLLDLVEVIIFEKNDQNNDIYIMDYDNQKNLEEFSIKTENIGKKKKENLF